MQGFLSSFCIVLDAHISCSCLAWKVLKKTMFGDLNKPIYKFKIITYQKYDQSEGFMAGFDSCI